MKLLIGILISIVAVVIILTIWVYKKTNSSATNPNLNNPNPHPNPANNPHPNPGTNPGNPNPNPQPTTTQKKGFWHWFWNIFWALFLIFACLMIFTLVSSTVKYCSKPNIEIKKSNETILDRGFVRPGEPWTTYVGRGYDFVFRTYSKTSFYVQYTSKRGGWTEPVFYPMGKTTIYLPSDIKEGPAEVSVGPENIEFEVMLVKK